jgi:hypothetical protein
LLNCVNSLKKRNSASGDNNISGRLAAVECALQQQQLVVQQESKTKKEKVDTVEQEDVAGAYNERIKVAHIHHTNQIKLELSFIKKQWPLVPVIERFSK